MQALNYPPDFWKDQYSHGVRDIPFMYKTDIFLDNLYKMKTRISNLNFLLTSILIENVFLWEEMGTNTGRMFAM